MKDGEEEEHDGDNQREEEDLASSWNRIAKTQFAFALMGNIGSYQSSQLSNDMYLVEERERRVGGGGGRGAGDDFGMRSFYLVREYFWQRACITCKLKRVKEKVKLIPLDSSSVSKLGSCLCHTFILKF